MKCLALNLLLFISFLLSHPAESFSFRDEKTTERHIQQPNDGLVSGSQASEDGFITDPRLSYFRKSNTNQEDDFEAYPIAESKNEEYFGTWTTAKSLQQFDSFKEISGYVQLIITYKIFEPQTEFLLWVYDGEYKDGQALSIHFIYNNNTDWILEENTSLEANSVIKATLTSNSEIIQEKYCSGNLKLRRTDSSVTHQSKDAAIELRIESIDCNIMLTMNATADNSIDKSRAMKYTIISSLVFLAHLYACFRIFRKVSSNPLEGRNYSLMTVGFLTAWDIFLCIFNFYSALLMKAFSLHFLALAVLYFILSSLIETKLILLIWRVGYSHQCQTQLELKQKLQKFYTQFYCFLGAFLSICCMFLPSSWLLYAASFFFVPQIAHNAIRGRKYKFDSSYILLLGLLKIIVPIYVKGFSHSLFRLTPSTSFLLCYPVIVLIQVLILYFQSRLGSRFFVPSFFLASQHNYFTKLPNNPTEEIDVCSICMEKLNQEPPRFNKNPSGAQCRLANRVMKTPCNHLYHEKCLRDWMDVKLECPFCRTVIPALE